MLGGRGSKGSRTRARTHEGNWRLLHCGSSVPVKQIQDEILAPARAGITSNSDPMATSLRTRRARDLLDLAFEKLVTCQAYVIDNIYDRDYRQSSKGDELGKWGNALSALKHLQAAIWQLTSHGHRMRECIARSDPNHHDRLRISA